MVRISVVGSINMDLVVVSEAAPQKGETIIGSDFQIIPGGKGANQAIAAARAGGNVQMFGCVGRDGFGEKAQSNLIDNKILLDNLKSVSDVPTGVALINVAEDDNRIVIVLGANACVDAAYIDSVRDGLLSSDLVLLQHEIPFETVDYTIRLCAAAGVPVILNPAPALPLPEELIAMVKYITPNEHEVNLVLQSKEPLDTLLQRYPNKLIVTLGKDGAAYHDGEKKVHIPAIDARPIDTTGAGDTFCGAFAKAIGDGVPLMEAIIFGQYASGLAIEQIGAQAGMPSSEEIKARMEKDKR
jgi:ribokinase